MISDEELGKATRRSAKLKRILESLPHDPSFEPARQAAWALRNHFEDWNFERVTALINDLVAATPVLTKLELAQSEKRKLDELIKENL